MTTQFTDTRRVEKAKHANKPVLVSIGYATCH